MPKIIELTVEIDVQRVSCPGVWLCQDGRVSLTVFTLGTSYQTCMLPPMFPLMFKDIFYYRKRYQETCAVNNICCLLKDETIYCELVQWCEDCMSGECAVLAQYLGSLNDVLFPPNMCSNDGVDLLMRRSKQFPGILSPKIEIATKVRIDEVWNQPCNMSSFKASACHCKPNDTEASRQKQVCHSAQYHRNKCISNKRPPSMSRSRSRSGGSRSCCSLVAEPETKCRCPNPITKSRVSVYRSPRPSPRPSPRRTRRSREYNVYSVHTRPHAAGREANGFPADTSDHDDEIRSNIEAELNETMSSDERLQKTILESRFIDQDHADEQKNRFKRAMKPRINPCICEICRRYHELFHTNYSKS